MSAATALRADSVPETMPCTASTMGISTWYWRASLRAAGRRGDAFDNLADLFFGLVGAEAAAHEHARMQVAAVHAGAGDDEVAHAGQPRKGRSLAAHGHAQAGQLGVAAGDEGGFGVVAVIKAQRHADGQGDHVFDRARPARRRGGRCWCRRGSSGW